MLNHDVVELGYPREIVKPRYIEKMHILSKFEMNNCTLSGFHEQFTYSIGHD